MQQAIKFTFKTIYEDDLADLYVLLHEVSVSHFMGNIDWKEEAETR